MSHPYATIADPLPLVKKSHATSSLTLSHVTPTKWFAALPSRCDANEGK